MEWRSGDEGRELVWVSLLPVKAVSVGGGGGSSWVGWRGEAALDAKLARTSSLKFQSSTSTAKISSQFCALATLR